MGIALSIKNLTFSYDDKVKVLKNINVDIEEGKYVSLIGHNGSGKSTLAKLIVGLLETRVGTIEIFGDALTEKNVREIRQKVSAKI